MDAARAACQSCRPAFIYGSGGHAKVVAEVIAAEGVYEVRFLIDDCPAKVGEVVGGHTVMGGRGALRQLRDRDGIRHGIVAIGNERTRHTIALELESEGFDLLTAVHPSAQISPSARVGRGTVVMAGAVVNAGSRIGLGAVINTRCSVDHDCDIGDAAQIAPGATLCGVVRVGARTFVGAGATVIPGVTIGADVIVGAGAVVIRDVPDGVTVVGVPARVIKSPEPPRD
ncbi:MAG TPA: acetyltransferase [Armatimonadota bacterium]|nr:acetyltransferase [Armatimonadota bacterium]